MNTWRKLIIVTLIAAGLAQHTEAAPPDEKATRLCDFETPSDVQSWEYSSGTPTLVRDGATHGNNALEIVFDPKGEYQPAYMNWSRVRGNWAGFDALVLDVFNPGNEPVPATVLIADKAWAEKGHSYWNRHNGSATFAPGHTRWVISVGGLYRGEAGSRNNDIKRNIDADSVVRLDFGFGKKGASGRIIIDDLRLIKVNRPANLWAFDFGPANQSVMPGWTPVSHATSYSRERGYGWGPGGGAPWNGADRDTTFGPSLLRDFCEAGGYRFRVDVPPGNYRVTAIYENCGYWGGEQAMHTTRRIAANGQEVWSERRPDGAAHSLYRFEDIEPVGLDIWDTYMKDELAKPAVFEAQAWNDGLTLQFDSDRTWGSKLSALVIYPAADTEAAKWSAGQLDAVAAEFRRMAVCLDPAPIAYEPPTLWKTMGLVAWPVTTEEDVIPSSTPPLAVAAPGALALDRLAARGEITTLCLALRPAAPLGACRVNFEWTKAPSSLPAETLRVWYNTSRDFNTIAYRTMPHTLRPCTEIDLDRIVTRELVIRVRIPVEALPGAYTGQLTLQTGRRMALRVPVRLTVAPVTVDRQTDFRMGFFGLLPPSSIPEAMQEETLDRTLALLRDYGMNLVCGGPDLHLKGWKAGEPVIDFKEMDRFAALLRRHGFTGPLNGYGGPRFEGLHDGYQKGESGVRVERESGLPYAEALIRAWKAVDAHGRTAGWPTIWYAMCDETRVRDAAGRELEFMKLMAKVSAAFPQTVRTSGSYSVGFGKRPSDPEDMLYWHQRFFEALDISDLNEHDATVMAEANRLGKQVHIYNQGTSRYSFGLYQWGEFRRGIRARTQWHLNVLHGYQFFDLDGREPDTAMLCYGRRNLYPTIQFERCREGAQDFHLCHTLWTLAEQARKQGRQNRAVEAAEQLLTHIAAVSHDRGGPAGKLDLDQTKASLLAAIESITQAH